MKVYSQLIASQFENLAADPATTALGYVYFNTTVNRFRVYNGSAWKDVESDLTSHTGASTSVHGVTGSVVGTTDTQVLTNKDIDGGTASNTKRITLPKDTLTNLSALTRKEGTIVYATDQAKAYLDNGSALTAVGSGGSGGAKSYAVDDDSTADGALGSNWGTFDDGAYPPVDGAGGTVTATLARTTSSPLQGAGSMLFTPGGQYDAAKFAFTIDRADFARMMKIEFDYEIGTYASYTDGDVKLAVVTASDSGFTTDVQVIQPAGHSILKVAGQETHVATFQSHASNLYYRVCLVQTTASTGYTLKIDNFKVGPQSVAYGAPVTGPVAYTPTITGFGTVSSVNFTSWRVGGYLFVEGTFTSGTTTTTEARITLGHNGYNANVSTPSTLPTLSKVGDMERNQTTAAEFGVLAEPSKNYLTLSVTSGSSAGLTKRNGDDIASSGQILSFTAKVQIAGWDSSVLMSDSADTRIVVANVKYGIGALVGLSAATFNVIDLTAVNKDTHGITNLTSNRLTAPISGTYLVTASLRASQSSGSQTAEVWIGKNGSPSVQIGTAALTTTDASFFFGTRQIELNAGDYIEYMVYTPSANGGYDQPSTLELSRISGPAQIAQSEKVAVKYVNTAGTSISTVATVPFATKVYDTHGAFNGSTFTAPTPGKYRITVNIVTAAVNLSTSQTMLVQFLVTSTPEGLSGASQLQLETFGNGVSHNQYINSSKSYQLNAGDTIAVQVSSDVATTLNTGAGRNFIAIEKVD